MDKIICIFGDSLTWGAGDTSVGGWTDRLKAYYQSIDPDVEIYNLGITSDTTDNVLDRFIPESEARGGTSAVFFIGINDSQYLMGGTQERMTLEVFRENILELIEQAGARDMSVAFLGLTRVDEMKTRPIAWRPDIHYHNDRIHQFDEVLKNICEDKELPYLELKDVLLPEDMPDGLHPNTEGHEKLITVIAPFLQTRLGL